MTADMAPAARHPLPAPHPGPLPARGEREFRAVFRRRLLASVSADALMAAWPVDWMDLKSNARALWRSAHGLGLQSGLWAERAAEVRARGGLLG